METIITNSSNKVGHDVNFHYLRGKFNRSMSKIRIEAILKERGMSKAELAAKMGVLPASLSRMLVSNSASTLQKIADALQVRLIDVADTQGSAVPHLASDITDNELNGYVECRGKVFKIQSRGDLFSVIAYLDGYTLNKEESDGK